MKHSPPTAFYERIREILESARAGVARTVNTTQVVANWLIGREIVEEEQRGRRRAEYGEALLEDLSTRLKDDFGAGYSVQNLRNMRQFYQTYPVLVDASQIRYALRSESLGKLASETAKISLAGGGALPSASQQGQTGKGYAARSQASGGRGIDRKGDLSHAL